MSKQKSRDPDLSEQYDFSKARRGVRYAPHSDGIPVVHVTDDEDEARLAVEKQGTRRAARPAKTS